MFIEDQVLDTRNMYSNKLNSMLSLRHVNGPANKRR